MNNQNPDSSIEEKLCPFCGETIKMIAIKCKHCQSFIDNKESEEVKTENNQNVKKDKVRKSRLKTKNKPVQEKPHDVQLSPPVNNSTSTATQDSDSMIQYNCPLCKSLIKSSEEDAGLSVKCPICGKMVIVLGQKKPGTMIKYFCPNCKKLLQSRANSAGMKSFCVFCGEGLVIPRSTLENADVTNLITMNPQKTKYIISIIISLVLTLFVFGIFISGEIGEMVAPAFRIIAIAIAISVLCLFTKAGIQLVVMLAKWSFIMFMCITMHSVLILFTMMILGLIFNGIADDRIGYVIPALVETSLLIGLVLVSDFTKTVEN